MNVADLMLNRRIDEYVKYDRALDPSHDWWPPHRRALVERRNHLRTLCLRGLKRCYPNATEAELDAFLLRAEVFR